MPASERIFTGWWLLLGKKYHAVVGCGLTCSYPNSRRPEGHTPTLLGDVGRAPTSQVRAGGVGTRMILTTEEEEEEENDVYRLLMVQPHRQRYYNRGTAVRIVDSCTTTPSVSNVVAFLRRRIFSVTRNK